MIHSLQAGGMERVMSELVNYFAAAKKYEVHLILYGLKRDVFYEVNQDVIIHKPNFEFDNAKRILSTIKTIRFLRKKIKEINVLKNGFNIDERILASCFHCVEVLEQLSYDNLSYVNDEVAKYTKLYEKE